MNAVPQRLAAALADRYRIERELGAGGMATVYLAADLKHDRKVAIKVLKPELAAVLGAERFVQEIKTTAALSHPHILPLFDSGEADGFLYYVMPYIEGETIREKLNRETQLGIEEAVRIATEVADALDYAHRNGVIHRDIKPENILLHDGRPMVMDFGIALAVSAAAGGRMTETGLSLGTPHYMSPEQATADKDITGRSDVYSLASVLYEMLAGEPPHMGNSAQQVIMKIIADTPRPVTELRKSVPAHVAAAIGRALEKLPADRFESARAFADASAASPDRLIGRTRGTVVLCLVLALVACAAPGDRGPAPFDRAEATAAVAGVLDALHHNASVADEEAYLALFAPEGVFFGTDATERWTVEEFRAYAHPYFERGQGWTYVLRQGSRHVDFDPTGRVAWFDEILDNASYGETRGTGVMRLVDGAWKITQYHLTIPVPNALADTVVEMIRRLEQAPSP